MAVTVALNHQTIYSYDRPVMLSPQTIRLRPAPHCRTRVTSYALRIEPDTHFLNWQQDPQSNYLARVVIPEKTRHFTIEVDLVAELTVVNPFDFFLEPAAESFPFTYESWLERELRPFREITERGPRLLALLNTVDRSPQQSVDFLVRLNQRIQHDVGYVIRMEPGVQTCEETLESGRGSCRDTAWLLVQVLRHLGLAARFVSGYLIQLTPDIPPMEGPPGPTEDFTDLHAWTEVYLPGAGWVGLDPTSGLFAGEGHLPVAATPDPASAAPISGAVERSRAEFSHHMSVTRIAQAPRVTKPYTADQWNAIAALGERIDGALVDADVRLTMGGEPTFVSADDMEGAEWNTEALGPEKRRRAETLVRRLRDRFATGGLLHYGQGKWYPGEPLPRWALTCYWRSDGHALWTDPALLADTSEDLGHSIADADPFIKTLATRVGVDPEYTIAAYEDPLHYLQAEGRLPINVSPADSRLERAEDRERLRRVFESGLGHPSGFVLPLQRAWSDDGRVWQSGLWMVRGRHLFLTPGDSPIGLRLPLQALPWVAPQHAPFLNVSDPFAAPDELPLPTPQFETPHDSAGPTRARRRQPADRVPRAGESADWVIRTGLAVQPREGRLHIFFPPLESVEDFVDLLAAVESTARAHRTPVVIEGYAPPPDHRLSSVKVTPDPGVIEVNVQPARSWTELVANTRALYDDARRARLGTEKFMLDGRHTGTGGGNHVVLGGPTPAESPFLRRPDLLRSLVTYWLNHPSLSYAFSSLFIGPTSQAPRVDEARADAVSELEIAFQEIDAAGTSCPPWLVDRVFRHLLADVTGNTHRSEFCIDKLYAPETATGRLGLVELRAFEMPPHPEMSLTQQLLLRGLIAWFWQDPYRRAPVHWGTRLHDQFMLPHYIEKDLHDVVFDLQRAGYAFSPDWLTAHLEFRYPRLGTVTHAGIELELRGATEPWYVLGEEPAGGAMARYVDSSVERVQIVARGMLGDRYSVTCNQRRLPLHPTGVEGEHVAGVRYRAWQPPSCLHPTIGVHTPLVFDVFDEWSERSVGGCTYHVAHPGGRNYDTFPVNASEAEARRAARFFSFGHTPGDMRPVTPPVNPRFPRTLDLRRT